MESWFRLICREMERQDRFSKGLCKLYISNSKRIDLVNLSMLLMAVALLIQSRRTAALEAEMEKYAKEKEKVGD